MSPEWRIYYSDGSTFDSTMGSPQEAPSLHVQVVIQKDKYYGRRICRMVDYYVWSPTINKWIDIFDSASLVQRALIEPYIVVKAGEYIEEEKYNAILIRANDDPDFPGKSPDTLSPMATVK